MLKEIRREKQKSKRIRKQEKSISSIDNSAF